MLKKLFSDMKESITSSPESIFKDKKAMALAKAVRTGDVEKIKTLVSDGISPNFCADDGFSNLLYWAILTGNPESFSTLLNVGADPTICNSDGEPMLHVAAQAKDIFYLQTLLERGVDPSLQNCEHGGDALFYAATDEHFILLLDAGIDMNAQDHMGNTSLHRASPEEAIIMLKRGADPTIRNKSGNTFQANFFGISEDILSDKGKEERRWLREWLQEQNIPIEDN